MDTPGKKGKRGKKGRKGRKGAGSDEEAFVRPAVDTSMGQMPEGALPSDEEGEISTNRKDDVFKQLDVNLDTPLRDDEVLPVRTHRIARPPSPRKEEDESSQAGAKKQRGKDKRRRKGKKVMAVEEGEEEEEEEEEEKETGRKRVGKKGEKKSSKKKHSKAVVDEEDEAEEPGLLDLSGAPDAPQSQADKKPRREKKEKSPAKKPEGDVDDLEFWLTPGDATATKEEAKPAPVVESRLTGDVAEAVSDTTAAKPKKTKKSKGERKSKSGRKGKKEVAKEEEDDLVSEGSGLLELVETLEPPQQPLMTFRTLAEDCNIELTYDIKGDPLHSTQVTVAVVFRNLSENTLMSMDFNVLDSLNVKLERPTNLSSHEGIPVPFQLPPGTANECQFLFYVKEFYVHQKLRGTVTYMMKSDGGTAQDKVDFKLQMPSSAFICPLPCNQGRFASLLGGGDLCETQSLKVTLKNTPDFQFALNVISLRLCLKIVEQIADSASLYGCSIAGHHMCFLIKAQGDQQLQVSAKGSDARLVSSLVDELKALV